MNLNYARSSQATLNVTSGMRSVLYTATNAETVSLLQFPAGPDVTISVTYFNPNPEWMDDTFAFKYFLSNGKKK